MFYLRKENELNRVQPSFIHLYVVRGILSNRVQFFSSAVREYIQPFLTCINSNQPLAKTFRATISYEKVVERRGAELIIRTASNIQYMKNSLDIIGKVNDIDFLNCNEKFINQVEDLVESKFRHPKFQMNVLHQKQIYHQT